MLLKKKALRENQVNIESKIRISQFSYTYVMNMKILEAVTPPYIYHKITHLTWIHLVHTCNIQTFDTVTV